jgi:hypothetical protein
LVFPTARSASALTDRQLANKPFLLDVRNPFPASGQPQRLIRIGSNLLKHFIENQIDEN